MNASVGTADAAALPATSRVKSSHVGLVLALLFIVGGACVPLDTYLTPRSGVGYWLGILGGSLMLALLIYPARKRIRGLAAIGSATMWFRIHMILGVAGPICILYHCAYHLGAANSNVAFFSMAIVATSGLAGRYLYGRIHSGLYGQKTSLAELRANAEGLKHSSGGAARFFPELASVIETGEAAIMRGVAPLPKAIAAVALWRYHRFRLRRYVRRTMHALATGGGAELAIRSHRQSLAEAAFRYGDGRLSAARRVAEYESCSNLFSLWHVLHLPLFGLLFIAGIVHVVAVNIY